MRKEKIVALLLTTSVVFTGMMTSCSKKDEPTASSDESATKESLASEQPEETVPEIKEDIFKGDITSTEAFVPSDDYGYIYPYFTYRYTYEDEDPDTGESFYSLGYARKYGFCDSEGNIICGPVFDYVAVVPIGEKDSMYEVTEPRGFVFRTIIYDPNDYNAPHSGLVSLTGNACFDCNNVGLCEPDENESLVFLKKEEGDDIVLRVYDVDKNEFWDEIRYSKVVEGILNLTPEAPGNAPWICKVISPDYILYQRPKGMSPERYLYDVKNDRFLPDPGLPEDYRKDLEAQAAAMPSDVGVDVIASSAGGSWIEHLGGTHFFFSNDAGAYIGDPDYNYLTPVFDRGSVVYEKEKHYAIFSNNDDLSTGYVYDADGNQVAQVPVTWENGGICYKDESTGNYRVVSECKDDSDIVTIYSENWEEIGKEEDTSGFVDYDQLYKDKNYEVQQGRDFDSTSSSGKILYGTEIKVDGESVLKYDGKCKMTADIVTGKHYVFLLIDDDHFDYVNKIYCLEDQAYLAFDFSGVKALPTMILDSKLVLDINGNLEGYEEIFDQIPMSEIYDISDINNPRIIFRYTADDAICQFDPDVGKFDNENPKIIEH